MKNLPSEKSNSKAPTFLEMLQASQRKNKTGEMKVIKLHLQFFSPLKEDRGFLPRIGISTDKTPVYSLHPRGMSTTYSTPTEGIKSIHFLDLIHQLGIMNNTIIWEIEPKTICLKQQALLNSYLNEQSIVDLLNTISLIDTLTIENLLALVIETCLKNNLPVYKPLEIALRQIRISRI